MSEELAVYLAPAPGVTCDEPEVRALARRVAGGSFDEVAAAVRLFEYVRDQVAYSAYSPYWEVEHYRATATLRRGFGYCIQKSALLCALARSLGLPARLGFADIENLLLGQKLFQHLGTNLMAFHGFAELYLRGRWVKATPSFERELCQKQGWRVVDFDGVNDALLPAEDLAGRPHVRYLRHHFTSPGVPLAEILAAWEEVYGAERMARWQKTLVQGLGRGAGQ